MAFGTRVHGTLGFGMMALCLAGCVQTAPGGGEAITGGDGPIFVTDEKGCRYEVILGQRYPIVDANGRPQCASL